MSRQNMSADKITKALILLMNDKEYSSISVSDITSEASVSRVCFYRNFNTKEEILGRFIDSVVRDIEEEVSKIHSPGIFDYYLMLFRGVSAYSDIIKGICKANLSGIMLDRFNEKLFTTPLLKECTSFEFPEYLRRFYTGAFYNVLISWVINGMTESPEVMADTCRALTGM